MGAHLGAGPARHARRGTPRAPRVAHDGLHHRARADPPRRTTVGRCVVGAARAVSSPRPDRSARETTPVELERPRPRSAGLLVARRLGVLERGLEEAVAQAGVDMELVLDTGLLERRTKLFDVVHPRA